MLAREWQLKRDDMHEAKIKEIEEAYEKWLSDYAKSQINQMEDEAAHSHMAAKNLKMSDL